MSNAVVDAEDPEPSHRLRDPEARSFAKSDASFSSDDMIKKIRADALEREEFLEGQIDRLHAQLHAKIE